MVKWRCVTLGRNKSRSGGFIHTLDCQRTYRICFTFSTGSILSNMASLWQLHKGVHSAREETRQERRRFMAKHACHSTGMDSIKPAIDRRATGDLLNHNLASHLSSHRQQQLSYHSNKPAGPPGAISPRSHQNGSRIWRAT